jgi:hypothetical protein
VGLSYSAPGLTSNRADRRVLWAGISLIVLLVAAWEAAQLWVIIDEQQAIGVDPVFYQDMGRRWLETGTFYTDRQLSGPYETTTLIDNLYPPIALYLFVPFVFLPLIMWWLIPLAMVGFVIWYLRPVAWSWPILALVIALPKTISAAIYGNSDLWVAAAVAGGVVLGWPAILAVFKPSLVYFAVIGINRISWWFMAAILVVLSLPLLPLWLQWPTVIANSTSGALYSIGNLPFMCLPILAWLFSRDRSPIARIRA